MVRFGCSFGPPGLHVRHGPWTMRTTLALLPPRAANRPDGTGSGHERGEEDSSGPRGGQRWRGLSPGFPPASRELASGPPIRTQARPLRARGARQRSGADHASASPAADRVGSHHPRLHPWTGRAAIRLPRPRPITLQLPEARTGKGYCQTSPRSPRSSSRTTRKPAGISEKPARPWERDRRVEAYPNIR